jgi:2C-methyl-D-erythritol 2,4-cyclodiphosphate synthase
MAAKLAALLGVGKDRVNVKATTNEGVGSIGKGEAIAAYALVTLEEKR